MWKNMEKWLITNKLRYAFFSFPLLSLLVFFHQRRHNFGTHITLSMGIPIETVGKMMGHMRIETTQLYAKVTDKKVDEDMKRLKAAGLSQTSGLYEEDIIVRKQRRKSQSQLSENKETTL